MDLERDVASASEVVSWQEQTVSVSQMLANDLELRMLQDGDTKNLCEITKSIEGDVVDFTADCASVEQLMDSTAGASLK